MAVAASVRDAVLNMTDGRCFYCGGGLNGSFHVDHVIPKSRGGADHMSNYVPACRSCNTSKGAKLLHEWQPSPLMPFGVPVGSKRCEKPNPRIAELERELAASRDRVRRLGHELSRAREDVEWWRNHSTVLRSIDCTPVGVGALRERCRKAENAASSWKRLYEEEKARQQHRRRRWFGRKVAA